jgi:hypothetical protein
MLRRPFASAQIVLTAGADIGIEKPVVVVAAMLFILT